MGIVAPAWPMACQSGRVFAPPWRGFVAKFLNFSCLPAGRLAPLTLLRMSGLSV
jgi:hypothetical protein